MSAVLFGKPHFTSLFLILLLFGSLAQKKSLYLHTNWNIFRLHLDEEKNEQNCHTYYQNDFLVESSNIWIGRKKILIKFNHYHNLYVYFHHYCHKFFAFLSKTNEKKELRTMDEIFTLRKFNKKQIFWNGKWKHPQQRTKRNIYEKIKI